MLWILAFVLTLLWALGLMMSYTLGGLIHILPVVAIGVAAWRIIQENAAPKKD